MKTVFALAITLALFVLSGCGTTPHGTGPSPETIASFIADAKDIAEGASAITLIDKPKSRGELETARNALLEFSKSSGPVDVDSLIRILTSLPTDSLKSPRGQIYVLGGKLVVRRFVNLLNDPSIDVAESGYIKQFAAAFASGIDNALQSNPPTGQ